MTCNSGSLLNGSSSRPSCAKSSITSQLPSVILDKGEEVARHTEDDAATTSRSTLHAKGPWSFYVFQFGIDPMALGDNVASSSRNDLGNNVALGSSEFWEYELFPQPTQQCGVSFTLDDLVANADQPSELCRLLRSPFLDTSSVSSRSSTAGSQDLQTSTSESGPSLSSPENSVTSPIEPFWDPQDPVLDAPFGRSRYSPIQCPGRTSENAQPMSAGRGFTRPYIEPSSYEPQWPLQQHVYEDGGDDMHQNFEYDMPFAQQEVHQGGSSSRANADGSGWGSHPSAESTPYGSLTISPAHSEISMTGQDFALHAQAQHQLRNDYCPSEMNYNHAAWDHQFDSGAMCALPELLGGFPRWVPLPAEANNQRGEGSSPQYAYQGYPSQQLPETSVMPNHQQQSPYDMTTSDLQDP